MIFEPGSYRDRRGRVFLNEGSVFRLLDAQATNDWKRLERSQFFQRNLTSGRVIETATTEPIADTQVEPWQSTLRHGLVETITYPYEWTFGMLRDAALLQLELLQEGSEEGFIVRDSTPYNIQWRGVKPVFIDIPSFGTLDPNSPWLGYRQFCQLFLNPLLLQSYRNVPFNPWLRGSLDGIDPETMRGLFGLRDVFRPGILSHVLLQSSLESRETRNSAVVREEMREAGLQAQLLKAVWKNLHKLVQGLQWRASKSKWSGYSESRGYESEDLKLKDTFVESACKRQSATNCWDLGANDGRFSKIASAFFKNVLAMDADLLVLERLYQELKSGPKNILPLYHNFADPSPGLGWRNQERRLLHQRVHPDLILCLAVFHHLVITANIPLEDLIQYLRGLNCGLVVEFVTREDAMVKALLAAKGEPFLDYSLENFEHWIQPAFEVKDRQVLPSGTRILFELWPLGKT